MKFWFRFCLRFLILPYIESRPPSAAPALPARAALGRYALLEVYRFYYTFGEKNDVI